MAPLETWRAKRRWTLTGKRSQFVDNSDSSYGEEILPTIDHKALNQLPQDEQKKFIAMRKQDRKNILRRWKKEQKGTLATDTSAAAGSTTSRLQRSPPPQLPELQIDVTHEFFGSSTTSEQRDTASYQFDTGADQNEFWNQYQQPGEATTKPHRTNVKASQQSAQDHPKTSSGLDAMDEARSARRNRRRGFYGAADAAARYDQGKKLGGSEMSMSSPPHEAASSTSAREVSKYPTGAKKGESSASHGMMLQVAHAAKEPSQPNPVTADNPFSNPGQADSGLSSKMQAPGERATSPMERVAQKFESGKKWVRDNVKGKKGMDAIPSARPAGGSRSPGEAEIGVARKVSVTRVSKPQLVNLSIYTGPSGGPGSTSTSRARMEGYE
ncbi:MAG: hypothetical protein LQ352_007681 [Teloschistes flavicans]|nr:MAG: hypothetical protein LQ352_007681 [Teloschistes flavicans]